MAVTNLTESSWWRANLRLFAGLGCYFVLLWAVEDLAWAVGLTMTFAVAWLALWRLDTRLRAAAVTALIVAMMVCGALLGFF